jgi:hypothetical protein
VSKSGIANRPIETSQKVARLLPNGHDYSIGGGCF